MKGVFFFLKSHLLGLRNRTYFETYEGGSGSFESEGAWRIQIANIGDDNLILTDSAGSSVIFPPGVFAELDGAPYIIRDDRFSFEFDGVGAKPLLLVVYDRVVKKKDDTIYPQEVYSNDNNK